LNDDGRRSHMLSRADAPGGRCCTPRGAVALNNIRPTVHDEIVTVLIGRE